MDLSYNGVHMELLQLDRVERDAVYSEDGADLLYVRWLIGATCVYGAGGRPVGTAATSISANTEIEALGGYNRSPNQLNGTNVGEFPWTQEENAPGNHRGYDALLTDVELRTRLWTPRRELVISAYDHSGRGLYWLRSPKPGFACDLAGGPKPIAVDVVAAHGEGTSFGVHFQVETAVSPCLAAADQTILSHRWQMTHTHDEDNYLTRVIEGTIVFNMAFIATSGVSQDSIRSQMFHPIPLGFKRTLGPISLSSDGSTLKYTIIDTDQTVVFDAGDSGATQMSIIENLKYTQPWRVAGGGLTNDDVAKFGKGLFFGGLVGGVVGARP